MAIVSRSEELQHSIYEIFDKAYLKVKLEDITVAYTTEDCALVSVKINNGNYLFSVFDGLLVYIDLAGTFDQIIYQINTIDIDQGEQYIKEIGNITWEKEKVSYILSELF